jgi:hypothetical protein
MLFECWTAQNTYSAYNNSDTLYKRCKETKKGDFSQHYTEEALFLHYKRYAHRTDYPDGGKKPTLRQHKRTPHKIVHNQDLEGPFRKKICIVHFYVIFSCR